MSVSTTSEIYEAIKVLKAGVRQAIKAMTDSSVARSKLESKLSKTETKLEEAKVKATAKKGTATATATVSNSAAATSESSSVASDKPLTATAAKELPEVQHLIGMVEQLDALTALVKGLPKPGKVKPSAKSASASDSDAEPKPKAATNAFIAWQPSKLFPSEWIGFKADSQAARDALQAQIDALESTDPDIAELKKRKKQIGSVMAFNALCRESTHKAEWEAFQAAWALDHPKKGGAMGGGGAL